MNPTATKVVAGVVLFLSGAVMGYFGSRLLVDRGKMAMLQHGDPRLFAEMFLRRMSGDLDLSEAQQAKLRPIVMNTAEKLIEIRRDQEPKVHETIEKSIADTKAVLTPEQLVKFTSITKRLEKRRKDMERFGPPPPPPGMGLPDMDGFPPPPPPPPGMEGFPPPPPGMEGFPPPPPWMEGLWPGPDMPPGKPAPESKAPPASKEPAAAKEPAATNIPAAPEKDAATPAPAPTAPAAGGNG